MEPSNASLQLTYFSNGGLAAALLESRYNVSIQYLNRRTNDGVACYVSWKVAICFFPSVCFETDESFEGYFVCHCGAPREVAESNLEAIAKRSSNGKRSD